MRPVTMEIGRGGEAWGGAPGVGGEPQFHVPPHFEARPGYRWALVATCCLLMQSGVSAQRPLGEWARQAQQRVVKIYGAGGARGLEGYQSGVLVSPDGHIATVWSYVLDVEPIVLLDDGRRFESSIVGFEPTLELAVLKIEAADLPYFPLDQSATVEWGDPVIAVSNLFNIATGNEPASVMQGMVAARSNLRARSGTFKTPYQGEVLVLDLVANNPGAAGGAVVDFRGRLVGMLGKELRDAETGVWLNYAVPAQTLRTPIGNIIAGRSTTLTPKSIVELPRSDAHNFQTLGLIMVPDILETTPAFIDHIAADSPAARAKLRPDDLILLLGTQRVDSQRGLRQLLRTIDRRDAVSLTIQRDTEILTVELRP